MKQRRLQKLEEQLRRLLSEIILYELKDPGLGFVTVNRVELSADLSYARVYISVLGDQSEAERTLRTLERARGFIQGRIGKELRTRTVPILRLFLDRGIEKSLRISKILDEIEKEGEPREPSDESGKGSTDIPQHPQKR